MRQAFSLLELLITIALLGLMVVFTSFYINTDKISKENISLQLKSHFNIITATILQCKELSNIMPIQSDGSLANDTKLETLECNTSTPYTLTFIPQPVKNFTAYTATQVGSEFYFTTTTNNPISIEALEELNSTYSSTQYELTDNNTTMNFYLSR